MQLSKIPLRISLSVLFLLVSGCGNGGSSIAPAEKGTSNSSLTSGTPSKSGDGIDRCGLLKDDEVQQVIGPHGPGTSDLNNEWGLQSCRWTSTTPQKVDGYPNGWFDLIEVAVFEEAKTTWAQEQAKGEPLTGFIEGAKFDSSYGELSFKCAGNRFCVVKVRTSSSKDREEFARKLSELVEKRVKS